MVTLLRGGRCGAWLAAAAACAGAASCAAAPETPAPQRHWVVTTREVFADVDAARLALARSAGLALRDIRLLSPRQFALTLDCDETTICERARQRLAADRETVSALEADDRQRIPVRPAPPATR